MRAKANPEKIEGPTFGLSFIAELDALITWRRDVRHFDSTSVPTRLIEELLDLADLAPSVGNSQPWRFVQVESPGARAKVCANFERENATALKGYQGERQQLYSRLKLQGLREAPVQFAVFCAQDTDQGHGLGTQSVPESLCYSVVTAIHTLWLATRARGLGLGWLSILDPQTLKSDLDIPADWRFIAYLCLGYPAFEDDQPLLARVGWQDRSGQGRTLLKR